MTNIKEIWKDIPNYEGLYQVSNLGRVKSLKFGKEIILKPGLYSKGYLKVELFLNGISKSSPIHRLVAQCFLNHNWSGYTIVVDHINGIKTDNRVDNLQLISQRENTSKNRNPKSKITGVYWHKASSKWTASIKINGKRKYLGLFESKDEAANAYQNELIYCQKILNLQ